MRSRYSFEKSVGGVVFREENGVRLFLLLHYEAGHWDFPKGHVEKGESETDTLKREIKEETGIAEMNIIPGFKKKISYFYKAAKGEMERRKKEGLPLNVIKNVVYYIVETKTAGIDISFEHTGFEWLSHDKALKRITYKSSKDVLREANNFLLNSSH